MSTLKRKLNILIIDDSEEDSYLVIHELQKSEFDLNYKRVDDEKTLTELISKENFDIVISDFLMPKLDAFKALEIIKKKNDLTPVIVLSGAIGEEIAVDLLRAGANDYSKKENLKNLLIVIQKELKEAELKKEQKRLENLLKVQREWAIEVSKAVEINEVFKICFHSVLSISGMDCGGIYLIDDENNRLELVYHFGLSSDFVNRTKSYDGNSEEMKVALKGIPVYYSHNELDKIINDFKKVEGLQTLGSIPVKFENKVIAAINIASHSQNHFPNDIKENIEFIVSHIGTTIVKARYSNQLKESEQKYRELVNGIVEGFYELDKDGIITYSNKSLAKIFGLKSEKEILGTRVFEYIKPDEKEIFLKKYREAVSSGKFSNVLEIPIIRKDNQLNAIIEVSAIPIIKDERIIGSRGLVSDKTEKILAQQEKENLNKELFEKNKELEQLIYISSHDLRTPLVNIIGFSNELNFAIDKLNSIVLEKSLDSDIKAKIENLLNIDINESLHYIKQSIAKIDTLLNGLLHFSRIGRNRIQKIEIDMNSLIKDILASFDFALKSKSIKVTIEDLPKCKADYFQINQVFSNLIDNAIKYFDPHKESYIKISGEMNKDFITYTVEDNGTGITEKEKEKVFEIFYRSNSENTQGEGLGLAIVKKILYMNNAKIALESKDKEYSKFFVSFPNE